MFENIFLLVYKNNDFHILCEMFQNHYLEKLMNMLV